MSYMSEEVFTFMVKTVKELLDESIEFDKTLSNVFGSDSYVITEVHHKSIENIELFLTQHFNDDECWIQYLIWEVLASNNQNLTIKIDNIEVPANIQNVYRIITGEFNN